MDPRRRALLAPLGLTLACSVIVGGCFTTSADYQRDAEAFILGDEDLAAALGIGFTSATCEEPASQAVGTTFTCTAQDDAGSYWEFEVEIQESNGYDINVSRRPTG